MTERADLAVLVCTRNRPDDARAAVSSLLAGTPADVPLIVIDQSDDDRTATAIASLSSAGRLRYLATPTRGLSAARNVGLATADATYVVMTDDDCTVAPGFGADCRRALAAHPGCAAVFFAVTAGEHDSSRSFVPVSVHRTERTVRRPTSYQPASGIGAGMIVHRETAVAAGGFDEMLGAGAPFRSGEEVDLVLRMLLRGGELVLTLSPTLVHHGARSHDEGRTLVRGYMFGSAALCGKLVRCGHPSAAVTFLRIAWASVVCVAADSVRHGRVPPVFGRVVWLAKGIACGVSTPSDRNTCTFRRPHEEDSV